MNLEDLPPDESQDERERLIEKIKAGEERFARMKREGYEIYMRNSERMFADRAGPPLTSEPPQVEESKKKRKGKKTDATGNALFGM